MRTLFNVGLVLAAVTLAGCNTAPILNVKDATVVSAAGKALSADQVKSAIVRAGVALGWQMKDAGPGKIAGSLNLRTHIAEVDIPYSASSYSITYKSSTGLGESGGQIHKNYNGWIQNLTKGINAQLGLAGT